MIAKFKSLVYWFYTINPDNSVSRQQYYLRPSIARSCDHVFVVDYDCSPISIIQRRSEDKFYVPNFGDKVYISKKSKISRDLVRKAYDITLSKDNADWIVIPEVVEFDVRVVNLVIDLGDGELALVNINDTRKGLDYNDKSRLTLVLSDFGFNTLTESGNVLFMSKNAKTLYLIPKVEEYVDILSSSAARYISDAMLPLKPDAAVSIETLDIWRRLIKSDFDLFEKSLLNSDVRDYPFTLTLFMENEDHQRRYFSEKPLEMLRQMGLMDRGQNDINTIRVSDWNRNARIISQKDWDMSQKWLMYNYGVDMTGGFSDKARNRYALKGELVRMRVAVAPIKIDHPMCLNDIIHNC